MSIFLRHKFNDDEEESVFVSMTDMMISLLFIVILLMAFFALQLRPSEETVAKSIHEAEIGKRDKRISALESINADLIFINRQLLERIRVSENLRVQSESNLKLAYIRNRAQIEFSLSLQKEILSLQREVKSLKQTIARMEAEQRDALDQFLAGVTARRNLLMRLIANRIEERRGIQVIVDERHGIIRFNNRDLFGSGKWRVNDQSQTTMQVIADAIHATLPCFTLGANSRFDITCNPDFAIIDAIQIEGHTDNEPTSGALLSDFIYDNLELAARRATETYRAMVAHQPNLNEFLNAEMPGQPVLSISGYGESRPIADNDTTDGRELNRRIDLRFIMTTPKSIAEVARFKRRLLEQAAKFNGKS